MPRSHSLKTVEYKFLSQTVKLTIQNAILIGYCECIIFSRCANFCGFHNSSLKSWKWKSNKIQLFSWFVTFSVWNHKVNNLFINAFSRNHENECPRINVLSQYEILIEWFMSRGTKFYDHKTRCFDMSDDYCRLSH